VTVTLRDVTPESILYIAQNLRERDRREVFATMWTDEPEELAQKTLMCGDFQWVVWKDDVPVASIGAYPLWPGVWGLWAFGTDRWNEVVRTLTKHIRRFMLPAILNAGAHRGQCHAMVEHVQARRWMKTLGAEEQAFLPGYGKNGEDFVVCVWDRDRTLSRVRTRPLRHDGTGGGG
jgi:hypothetical protein